MKDIQQLIKKENNQEYKDIYPKTFTDAVLDKHTGANLADILNSFNMYFIAYAGSKEVTRVQVPTNLRRKGLWITYIMLDDTIVTEYYNGSLLTDDAWQDSANWINSMQPFDKFSKKNMTCRFDGFTDKSTSSKLMTVKQGGEIVFSITDNRFYYLHRDVLYAYWEVKGKPSNTEFQYKDSVYTDKLFLCKDRAYVMYNGTLVDIARFTIDKELSLISNNPIANSTVTKKINEVNADATTALTLARELKEEGRFQINGNVTNNPDEEDITVEENKLKFKDKNYNAGEFSGLGRVYLRKNIVNGKNVLTQEMINKPNTIYIIQYDYDLDNKEINIPNNCTLQFEGGSFSNGILNGFSSNICSFLNKIFYNIKFNGSYSNIFELDWFVNNYTNSTDDYTKDSSDEIEKAFNSGISNIRLNSNKFYYISKTINIDNKYINIIGDNKNKIYSTQFVQTNETACIYTNKPITMINYTYYSNKNRNNLNIKGFVLYNKYKYNWDDVLKYKKVPLFKFSTSEKQEGSSIWGLNIDLICLTMAHQIKKPIDNNYINLRYPCFTGIELNANNNGFITYITIDGNFYYLYKAVELKSNGNGWITTLTINSDSSGCKQLFNNKINPLIINGKHQITPIYDINELFSIGFIENAEQSTVINDGYIWDCGTIKNIDVFNNADIKIDSIKYYSLYYGIIIKNINGVCVSNSNNKFNIKNIFGYGPNQVNTSDIISHNILNNFLSQKPLLLSSYKRDAINLSINSIINEQILSKFSITNGDNIFTISKNGSNKYNIDNRIINNLNLFNNTIIENSTTNYIKNISNISFIKNTDLNIDNPTIINIELINLYLNYNSKILINNLFNVKRGDVYYNFKSKYHNENINIKIGDINTSYLNSIRIYSLEFLNYLNSSLGNSEGKIIINIELNTAFKNNLFILPSINISGNNNYVQRNSERVKDEMYLSYPVYEFNSNFLIYKSIYNIISTLYNNDYNQIFDFYIKKDSNFIFKFYYGNDLVTFNYNTNTDLIYCYNKDLNIKVIIYNTNDTNWNYVKVEGQPIKNKKYRDIIFDSLKTSFFVLFKDNNNGLEVQTNLILYQKEFLVINKKGTTAQRPTGIQIGFTYKDTDLNKWIIWNGEAWENIDGTALG